MNTSVIHLKVPGSRDDDLDAFVDVYEFYRWVRDCNKLSTASKCVNDKVAKAAVQLAMEGNYTDPKILMKKIKHLDLHMPIEAMLRCYDDKLKTKGDNRLVEFKKRLRVYIISSDPDPLTVRRLWLGVTVGLKGIKYCEFLAVLEGKSLLTKSKVTLADDYKELFAKWMEEKKDAFAKYLIPDDLFG